MTVNEASPSPKGQLRSWGTHVFLVACIALVIVFFVWASMGKLDVVSTAATSSSQNKRRLIPLVALRVRGRFMPSFSLTWAR